MNFKTPLAMGEGSRGSFFCHTQYANYRLLALIPLNPVKWRHRPNEGHHGDCFCKIRICEQGKGE